jgi:uncharacterized membrane protein YadS
MIFVTTYVVRRNGSVDGQGKAKIPVFIFLFVLAVIIHALLPEMPQVYKAIDTAGKSLLRVAIFLIGAQLSRSMIKSVGSRALAMGVILWVVMGTGSLLWVRTL